MSELAENRVAAGRALYLAGNYVGAERMLKQALAADPESAMAYCLLALTLYQLGKGQAALEAANAAVAIEPNANGLRAKALALSALKRTRDALEAARAAVAADPEDEFAIDVLASQLEDSKRPKEADAAYRRALEIAPASQAIRGDYGRFLLRQKRFADAEAQAEALDPSSDQGTALVLRGEIALLRGHTEKARDFALWVLSKNATNPAALNLLVEVKASRSPIIGLWWRYSMFMRTRPTWQRIFVIIPIMAIVCFLMSPLALLVFLYFRLSSLRFESMIRRELKAVTLKKSF